MHQSRWYQEEAISSIFQYFAEKNGNPVIAMPTASGKTHVIGGFMQRVLGMWPDQRFIVATHVKELIEQNATKFAAIWPSAPYGIHSAGMNARETAQPIIFGGIQSMIKNPQAFGHRDLMIVDECHLVSPNDGTRYQGFIAALREVNPKLKVIGLSATIYRMGIGLLTDKHEGQVFTDVCYDLTTIENFDRLIREGWLTTLIPKRTSVQIDVSSVDINSGDYNQRQLEAVSNQEHITRAALAEAASIGKDRYSWLAFAAGIDHAERINYTLNSMGIPSVVVHSKVTHEERNQRINMHKRGEVRCLVGNNIFTTGYDHPPLDMIIDLQATASTPKHVQKYGRGMRPFPGSYVFPPKQNCLVLDYAGNTVRLGPINDPVIPKLKGKGTGDAPVKICEFCETYNHTRATVCVGCGAPFTIRVNINQQASTHEILKSDIPAIEVIDIDAVHYAQHIKKSTGVKSLRVSYWAGMTRYTEWVPVENPKGKHLFHQWWRQRHTDEPPQTVEQILSRYKNALRRPQRIRVWVNHDPPRIIGVEW